LVDNPVAMLPIPPAGGRRASADGPGARNSSEA